MSSEAAVSITKNTTVMMSSQMVTWVSSFILMMFLPRYLGSEDYGRLYLAVSVGMIFQIIIEFGGSYFIPKEISRHPERAASLAMNFIGIRALLWLCSLIIMMVFAYAAGYSGPVRILILIMGIAKLWEGTGGVLRNCMQGFEKMEYASLAIIAERLFLTAVGVTALLMGAHSVTIAVIMSLSTLVSFFVNRGYFKRIVSQLPKFQWRAAKDLTRICLPYFLYSLFAVAYYRIDAVMLSLMTPESVVGWYGAAYRFFDIFMFLPSIFSTAVFPVLSRLWTEEKDAHARTMRKSLELVILAGIPISIGVFAFADQVIQFFFGAGEFGPSATVLRIFAPCILLVYIDIVLGTVLFASDKQRQWTIVAFLALLLNPFLNYYTIPYTQTHLSNGGIGAAIATLTTELFVLVAAVTLIPEKVFKASFSRVLMKGAVAGAMMIAAIFMLNIEGLSWFVQALLGSAIYLLALFSMKTMEPEEMNFLKTFFSATNLKKILFTKKELVV